MFKALAVTAAVSVLLCGCGREGYDDYVIPSQQNSQLTIVGNNDADNHYEGIAPTVQETLRTVTSADGLCTIECKKDYYDITLDYEKGSYYDVGKAYGEEVIAAEPDYVKVMEQYLFENITSAFPNIEDDFSDVVKRCDQFYNELSDDYRDELDGFADAVSGNSEGIKKDGIFSDVEVRLLQFIPDALRGTACSGISVDGSMTASGKRISSRVLEWQLGSENQISRGHSVVHYLNGDRSFTSVTYLGFFPILTAVNDDGVMLSEYDVGSWNGEPFVYESKRSYTYDMRYVVEEYTTAQECAEYLVANAENYPYCVNVMATDDNDALVAELVVESEDGAPVIRDSSTELMKYVEWSDPACICVVNSFAAQGNADKLSIYEENIIRWKKYEKLFCGQKGLTIGHFKELMTREKRNDDLVNILGPQVVHMVIADYSERKMQAVFVGQDGIPETPEFIDLGSWEYSR
jgi:hypothetical protein